MASAAPQLALPAPSTCAAGSTEAPQPQDSPREQALALANQVPQPSAEPAAAALQVASVPSAAGLASLPRERRDLEKDQKAQAAQDKETKKSTKLGLKARPAACPGLLKRPAAACQVQEPPAKKQRPEPETRQKPHVQNPEAATPASTKAVNNSFAATVLVLLALLRLCTRLEGALGRLFCRGLRGRAQRVRSAWRPCNLLSVVVLLVLVVLLLGGGLPRGLRQRVWGSYRFIQGLWCKL